MLASEVITTGFMEGEVAEEVKSKPLRRTAGIPTTRYLTLINF